MPPHEYQRVRTEAADSGDTNYHSTVFGRPYLPYLRVDAETHTSAAQAAAAIVLASRGLSPVEISDALEANGLDGVGTDAITDGIEVMKVCGGITNLLFRVTGLSLLLEKGTEAIADFDDNSVLVRVFGAEGMIDRDVETSTYAALCDAGVAHRYVGRFGNGRIEGWLDSYETLQKTDFCDAATSNAVAVEMARLHYKFRVPESLQEWHNVSEPAMWTQLHSWMDQAQSYEQFKTPEDDKRARALDLSSIRSEISWLEDEVCPPGARVVFCHNDLLAANIMRQPATGQIQLIDFEYGGVNFVAFDVANHFNEHAGGTDDEDNGVPNYALFPSKKRQEEFVRTYVRAAREIGGGSNEGVSGEEEEVRDLLVDVGAFILANHLYWGLWAVNQVR